MSHALALLDYDLSCTEIWLQERAPSTRRRNPSGLPGVSFGDQSLKHSNFSIAEECHFSFKIRMLTENILVLGAFTAQTILAGCRCFATSTGDLSFPYCVEALF